MSTASPMTAICKDWVGDRLLLMLMLMLMLMLLLLLMMQHEMHGSPPPKHPLALPHL